MALTLSEMRVLVKQALGGRTSTTITDSTGGWYDTRINNAYRRLVTFQGPVMSPGRRQPEMRRLWFYECEQRTSRSLTTALADNFVAPSAARCAYVIDIFDRTHDRGLDRVSLAEMRQRDPEGTGVPRSWCPAGQGGVLGYYIYPKPGAAADEITVYESTYNYPADLAVDGTAPAVPAEWHNAIWYAAVAEGALLLEIPERAAEFEQKFMNEIATRRTAAEDAGLSGYAGARRYIGVG